MKYVDLLPFVVALTLTGVKKPPHSFHSTEQILYKVSQAMCLVNIGSPYIGNIFSLHVSRTFKSVVSSSVFRSLLFAHCRRIISTVPPAPSTAGSPVWSGIPPIPPLWPWGPKVVTYICGTTRCPRRKPLFKGWVPVRWPGLFYQILEWPTARDVQQMKRRF